MSSQFRKTRRRTPNPDGSRFFNEAEFFHPLSNRGRGPTCRQAGD